MNLKNQYALSVVGIVSASFGFGWLALSHIVGVSPISELSGIGITLAVIGMAITLLTLRTIKKIDLIVEDYPTE